MSFEQITQRFSHYVGLLNQSVSRPGGRRSLNSSVSASCTGLERSTRMQTHCPEGQSPRMRLPMKDRDIVLLHRLQPRVKLRPENQCLNCSWKTQTSVPILRLCLRQSDQPRPEEVLSESEAVKVLWSQWHCLTVRNNVLYRIATGRKDRPARLQLVVPSAKRTEFIRRCHEGMTGGHRAFRSTLEQVRR